MLGLLRRKRLLARRNRSKLRAPHLLQGKILPKLLLPGIMQPATLLSHFLLCGRYYQLFFHSHAALKLRSKKQKVSGAYHDQSIEQLNDVTAVSGVNLRVHLEISSLPLDMTRLERDLINSWQGDVHKLCFSSS